MAVTNIRCAVVDNGDTALELEVLVLHNASFAKLGNLGSVAILDEDTTINLEAGSVLTINKTTASGSARSAISVNKNAKLTAVIFLSEPAILTAGAGQCDRVTNSNMDLDRWGTGLTILDYIGMYKLNAGPATVTWEFNTLAEGCTVEARYDVEGNELEVLVLHNASFAKLGNLGSVAILVYNSRLDLDNIVRLHALEGTRKQLGIKELTLNIIPGFNSAALSQLQLSALIP